MEDKNCKVGQLIQSYNDDGSVNDGKIIAIIPPVKERPKNFWEFTTEQQEEFKTHLTVKYEDGTEETVSTWDVDPRDSDIEREFRLAAPSVIEKINKYISEASLAMDKAVDLSEKYGIPFYSHISPLSQGYRPESFDEKYNGVSDNIMSAIADCNNEYAGWQHSAVCY